jgi:hypothetical protein
MDEMICSPRKRGVSQPNAEETHVSVAHACICCCASICRVPAFQDASDFDTPLTAGEDANFVSSTEFVVPGLVFQGTTPSGQPVTEFHREWPSTLCSPCAGSQ